MRTFFKHTLMLLVFVPACTAELTEAPDEGQSVQTLQDELPDQYTWLVDHGVALTCDEAIQVDRGEVLWDHVTKIQEMHPEDRGFITKRSLIRVLNPRLVAEYKRAVDSLPVALQSDPSALADVRARLKIQSALTPVDNRYDLLRMGRDPAATRLVPARVAAPPPGCALPVIEEAPDAALLQADTCTDPVPDPGTGGGPSPDSTPAARLAPGSAPVPELSGAAGAVAADAPPVCASSCKVTCDLAVAVDSLGADSVSSKKTITYGQWVDGSWESDTAPGDGSDYSIAASRHRYFTTAFTCRAVGCENDTWKANVSQGNLGDGKMTVNVAGSTDNPDMVNGWDASCTVAVNALAKTTLTMDKNAEDCGAANKNPTFDHKLEILYAVHSESKFDSSSELSGSVSLEYTANQNTSTGAKANIKASGAGKDGLKIDGVDVSGDAANTTTYSASGKAGASYAFRRAKQTGSKWQSGATTLDFLDQINGPPSMTMTNECPQKTITYKYDLDNFRSSMRWDVGTSWSKSALCASRIEATMPTLPKEPIFQCTYTTKSGGGNVKDCAGTLKLPK